MRAVAENLENVFFYIYLYLYVNFIFFCLIGGYLKIPTTNKNKQSKILTVSDKILRKSLKIIIKILKNDNLIK